MIILKNSDNDVLNLSTLENFSIKWERSDEPQGRFSNIQQKIPKVDRIWYFGTDYGNKELKCTMVTARTNLQLVDAAIATLNNFIFDVNGDPKRLRAYQTFEVATEVKYSNVRLHEPFKVTYGTKFHTIDITFVTEDRYKYAEFPTIKEATVTTDYTWTPTVSIVKGLSVPPTIKLVGTTGTDVKLSSDGKDIIVGTVTGKTITIDTERYVAKDGTFETLIKIPKDFRLIPDKPFTVTGTSMDIALTLTWRNRYL